MLQGIINQKMYVAIQISWISGGSGISQRAQQTPNGGEQQSFILHIFCRKLHENERHWTEGGGGCGP